MWGWIVVLALIALAAYAPVWAERRRVRIGKSARRGAPGQFARLSQGVTHYQWHGPVRGPVIVAIHGLTTPSDIWNNIIPRLAPLGFRVLTYDLYGRGLSDAPKGAQDAAFFLRQLNDLLEHEGISDEITVMGYSMGGSIATAFTSDALHRVQRLILMAPAGMLQNESPFSRFCRSWPVIGDWVFAMGAPRRITRESAATARQGQETLAAVQLRELSRAGYLPAVLSSRRHMLAATLEQEHRAIDRTDIPVIAIWGRDDTVIPLQALGKLTEWSRRARQDVIDGADHALPYTHADQIAEVLRDILTEKI